MFFPSAWQLKSCLPALFHNIGKTSETVSFEFHKIQPMAPKYHFSVTFVIFGIINPTQISSRNQSKQILIHYLESIWWDCDDDDDDDGEDDNNWVK